MEQKESDDAQHSELLTPTDMPVKTEGGATEKGTGVSPDGEESTTTMSQGMHQREVYCL